MAGSALKARIVLLERRAVAHKKGSLAERLKTARERWRALSAEEQDQRRHARLDRLARQPAPPQGTLARRLWDAAQRAWRERSAVA